MTPEIVFPDPELADQDGLLAYGGNLEVETLLTAYRKGIFPWYNDDSPILWWSPDPRMVLFPEKFKLSKSLKQKINRKIFNVAFDNDFQGIIKQCAEVERKNQPGTWINSEMQQAYIRLHQAGFAHSVETYYGNKLVGGLYGVAIGKAFFGESMFHLMTDASKVALFSLVSRLKKWNYMLIDVQQSTAHLKSLGAEDVPRQHFLSLLNIAIGSEGVKGSWKEIA